MTSVQFKERFPEVWNDIQEKVRHECLYENAQEEIKKLRKQVKVEKPSEAEDSTVARLKAAFKRYGRR